MELDKEELTDTAIAERGLAHLDWAQEAFALLALRNRQRDENTARRRTVRQGERPKERASAVTETPRTRLRV